MGVHGGRSRPQRNLAAASSSSDVDGTPRARATLVKVVVHAGPNGIGCRLDAYNTVVDVMSGAACDLRLGDKIMGVEVDGRRILCGTGSLANILPRDRSEHTLCVMRKPPPVPAHPGRIVEHEQLASQQSGRQSSGSQSSFDIKVHAVDVAAWPAPRGFVPAAPSSRSCATALPRPPAEDAEALMRAFRLH